MLCIREGKLVFGSLPRVFSTRPRDHVMEARDQDMLNLCTKRKTSHVLVSKLSRFRNFS